MEATIKHLRNLRTVFGSVTDECVRKTLEHAADLIVDEYLQMSCTSIAYYKNARWEYKNAQQVVLLFLKQIASEEELVFALESAKTWA